MRNLIIGTAGHIDHGKSALVEALTGVHPDRLKEEKERGITIDLGFAHLSIRGEVEIGFVDVPGHERFIKNMLAGVGGVDAVMLVIAADESVMPQTREHLEICDLLKVPTGVVVVTKIDLVEPDLLELVKSEVQAFLKGTFLEGAPQVCVSSRTGTGIAELKDVLYQLCQKVPPKSPLHTARLPIDRVFSFRGHGTVITGTLVSGSLKKDQEVEIYPIGLKGRIRGIQVHSMPTQQAFAGQRTAVNLPGIEVQQLRRGMEIGEPGRFTPVRIFDAQIQVLKSSPVTIRDKMHARFHHGTAEIMGTMIPITSREIKPGEMGFARVTLEESTLLLVRDRFIFRRVSPLSTLGGGMVMDIHPSRERRFKKGAQDFLQSIGTGQLEEIVMPLVLRSGKAGFGETQVLSQTPYPKVQVRRIFDQLIQEKRVVSLSPDPMEVIGRETFEEALAEVCGAVQRHHQVEPLSVGVSKEQLLSQIFRQSHPNLAKVVFDALVKANRIVVEQEKVRLFGHRVVLNPVEGNAKDRIERTFRDAAWKVPPLEEVLSNLSVPRDQARNLVAMLVREKKLVKISEGLVFHTEMVSELKRLLAEYKKSSDRIDVGQFKELIDVSRKYAIPLLEYLDRERITRRVGDFRLLL